MRQRHYFETDLHISMRRMHLNACDGQVVGRVAFRKRARHYSAENQIDHSYQTSHHGPMSQAAVLAL